MKRLTAAVIFLLFAVGSAMFAFDYAKTSFFQPTTTGLEQGVSADNTSIRTVATDLEVPWGIEFLPNGDMLVTERPGTLVRIGDRNTSYEVEGVISPGEGGLLGVEKHPEFSENGYIYLYQTTQTEDGFRNRVVRYVLDGDQLRQPETIIEDMPGAFYHDGGALEFGPKGYLYVTVGDATEKQKSQDLDSLHGKILRLEPDGSVPESNPFDSEVYSYGHRNPQGITWDSQDRMWATEHGSTATDELNLIEKGANYGWPEIRGNETAPGMKTPVRYSGYEETWAPAGLQYHNESLYFAGLRGQSLYEAELEGEEVVSVKTHFRKDFGRLRAVTLGPDGFLYFSTSNRDGRGQPGEKDDRILKVDPAELE